MNEIYTKIIEACHSQFVSSAPFFAFERKGINMSEKYMTTSLLTQKEYDLFSCVKIVNIQQACAYMENGIMPVDVKASRDNKTDK